MADQAKNGKSPALSRERRSSHTDELSGIAASITAYYDLSTDEEVAEDAAWGEFAITQFPEDDQ